MKKYNVKNLETGAISSFTNRADAFEFMMREYRYDIERTSDLGEPRYDMALSREPTGFLKWWHSVTSSTFAGVIENVVDEGIPEHFEVTYDHH
jgi:hypothetical protein